MKRIAEVVDTDEPCSYGCGQVAKYKNGSGKLMCCERHNSCPAIRERNSLGVGKAHSEGLIPTNFGDNRGWRKDNFSANFEYGGTGSHKKVLIQERGYCCEGCGNSEWRGKPIMLELEHTDGDNQNNKKENLKLLCPNCHAQTSTWRRKKDLGRWKRKYSDEEIIEAVRSSANMNQCLRSLNLSWGSGETILKVMFDHKLTFGSAG